MDSIFKLIAELHSEGNTGVSLRVTPVDGLWRASIVDLTPGTAPSVLLDRFGEKYLTYVSIKPEYALEGLNELCKIGE